jgi:uncharacterized membrane protein
VGGVVDDTPTLPATSPKLEIVDGAPVVAYRQETVNGTQYPVYIHRWDGVAWTHIDPGGLYTPPSYQAAGAWAIAADGDLLYAAWLEYGPALIRRRVSKRNPHTGVWSDIGTWGGSPMPYGEISIVVNGTTPYVANDEYFDSSAHVRVMSYR